MITYDLALKLPKTVPASIAKTTFFWTPKGSFDSTYDAQLSVLGPVQQPNIEFVRIAAAVFAADRSTKRQSDGSNWRQREIQLNIPVFDVSRWQAVKEDLCRLLNFLTGDSWSLHFIASPTPPKQEELVAVESDVKRVVLLSGGADSASGALVSRAELGDGKQILVSHVGAKNISPIQQMVAKAIEGAVSGATQTHLQINFRRHTHQIDGSSFPDETSSRSRSLLFLAFGLAVASRHNVQLWMPENGFASLNPPLGPERRGSLSTRTTHPYFLRGLAAMLSHAGAHADFVNPFEQTTKGEMFTQVAKIVGKDQASAILSMTHSCSTTGARSFGLSPNTQCGVCFGCVVRRASFKAAGLVDRTAYIDPKHDPRLPKWLATRSVDRAMGDFLYRGLQKRDVAAMHLPDGYTATQAYDLCQRGLSELQGFYS
jgi:7-cyano-7-deazaguanine synthase in queuosine biosynthesis